MSGILCSTLAVLKFMLGKVLTSRALITDGEWGQLLTSQAGAQGGSPLAACLAEKVTSWESGLISLVSSGGLMILRAPYWGRWLCPGTVINSSGITSALTPQQGGWGLPSILSRSTKGFPESRALCALLQSRSEGLFCNLDRFCFVDSHAHSPSSREMLT